MTGTTDSAIQRFVQRRHGFVPTTGWISRQGSVWHADARCREPPGARPSPPEKREAIEQALRHWNGSLETLNRRTDVAGAYSGAEEPGEEIRAIAQATSALLQRLKARESGAIEVAFADYRRGWREAVAADLLPP